MGSKAKFQELIKGSTPTLVDFYADWCGPCHALKPILQKLKDEMGDSVRIIKIDVDKNPMLAQQYQIQGIPTLMLFRDQQMQWRQSGVVPLDQLKNVVQQFVEVDG